MKNEGFKSLVLVNYYTNRIQYFYLFIFFHNDWFYQILENGLNKTRSQHINS